MSLAVVAEVRVVSWTLEVLTDSDGARALEDGERTPVDGEEAIPKKASLDALEGPRSSLVGVVGV